MLARWLLLLALLFDLTSAPFHRHHHEGVDAQFDIAALHDAQDDGNAHFDADEHGPGSHAALALRNDSSLTDLLPDVDLDQLSLAILPFVQELAGLHASAPVHWKPDRSASDFRSHRSLPPAGRAPPLHA